MHKAVGDHMVQRTAIIFDLDGTLVHSVPDMHVSLNRVLESMGRQTLTVDTVQSFVGNGVAKLIKRALAATGSSTKAEQKSAMFDFLDDYARQKTVLTRPYDGVISCLSRLQARGVPMGVCTNKPQEAAREMCEHLSLHAFFKNVTGAQKGVPTKPDVAPLAACADHLGVSLDQVIFVGDSKVDFDTAQNARVPFYLYRHGYLNHPLPDLREEQAFDNWETVDFGI